MSRKLHAPQLPHGWWLAGHLSFIASKWFDKYKLSTYIEKLYFIFMKIETIFHLEQMHEYEEIGKELEQFFNCFLTCSTFCFKIKVWNSSKKREKNKKGGKIQKKNLIRKLQGALCTVERSNERCASNYVVCVFQLDSISFSVSL